MGGGNVVAMRDPEEAWEEIRRRRLAPDPSTPTDPSEVMRTAASYIENLEEAIREGEAEEAGRLLNFADHVAEYLRSGSDLCDCED